MVFLHVTFTDRSLASTYIAFATPNSSNGISYDSGSTSILQRLVTAAHNSGYATKIVLSIGGWDGSYYFSQVMNSSNRQTFVNACVSAVNTYKLDGAYIRSINHISY